MDSEKLALICFFAVIAAALAIIASSVAGCSLFDRVTAPINEPCTSNELRCNGSMVQECTGRQWYDHYDCAKITKDGEPMTMECVSGRCE